ncbi:MAG: hypothetical protein AB7P21_11725 [Lautropia sp.]
MTLDNWLTELSRLPLQAMAILLAVFLLGFLAGVAYGRRQVAAERQRSRRRRIKREARQAFQGDDTEDWNTRFVPQADETAPRQAPAAGRRSKPVPAGSPAAAPPTEIVLASKADPESRHAFRVVAKPIRVEASLRVKYLDHDGVGSYRSLRVQAFGNDNGETLLLAHCSLRGEVRCFHLSRILACVDKTDGHVVDDLHDYLKRAAATTVNV